MFPISEDIRFPLLDAYFREFELVSAFCAISEPLTLVVWFNPRSPTFDSLRLLC